jgi:hypothetical protein
MLQRKGVKSGGKGSSLDIGQTNKPGIDREGNKKAYGIRTYPLLKLTKAYSGLSNVQT